jgi:E3 ubiquitin-protein ligase HUWE1
LAYLEALPDDIRQEVINEHLRSQPQTQSGATLNSDISEDFLAALPYEIREELLRQERLDAERRSARVENRSTNEPTAASRPSGNFTASNFLLHFENAMNGVANRSHISAVPPVVLGHKKVNNRDSMQLLDKSGITSLLRLVFIPEPCGKTALNRILTNLCENSKTRTDLLNILVSILEDGTQDLAVVDKGLSELSLKSDKSQRMKWVPPNGGEIKNVSNLVAQRCLESLTLLVTSGSSSSRYFLTESDREHIAKTPKSSRKGKEKEKEKTVIYHIPAVSLLKLLERSSFLQNSSILEQLMNLLSNVLRPLSIIAKRKQAQLLEDAVAKPDMSSELPESKQDIDPTSEVANKEKTDIKLPVIPEMAVRCVVNVLKDGICTLKTFQNTLHAIQYISAYPEHHSTIMNQLVESAQEVSNAIAPNLLLLISQLKLVTSSIDMDENTLSSFAAPTADQAKLLRILKTIDFLNKPDENTLTKAEDNANEDVNFNLRGLYDKLNITGLWQKLSEAMSIVEQKESMIHVATVLLPLIESFLVKSKPFVHGRKVHLNVNLLKQNSDLNEEDIGPNSFFQFTKDHSKILNTYSNA